MRRVLPFTNDSAAPVPSFRSAGEGNLHEDEGKARGKDARHCLDLHEEEGGVQSGLPRVREDHCSAREPAEERRGIRPREG